MNALPVNTQDAMQTGCLNAASGAILLMCQQLEKHCGVMPKIVISGGDADKIAEALNTNLLPGLKQVIIAKNLVLHGLVMLEKE